MATSGTSSTSSPPALSPSPNGSLASTLPVPMPPPVKQRKKPGPKPKPKPAAAASPASLMVKLKIKSSILSELKGFPAVASTTATADGTPNGSSPNGTSPQPTTSSPGNADSALPPTQKRRGIPGPKPGTKRGRAPGVLLAKPGRKKTKLDPSAPGTGLMNGTAHAVHGKPGPKANTGAINDKLRALDRTGKPCKRWAKAGFTLKSFTGVQWTVPTWAAPVAVNGNTETPTENTSADVSVTADTPPEIKIQNDAMFPTSMMSENVVSQGIAV